MAACSSTTVMSFCSSARCSASVPPTCPAPRIMIFTGLWTLPTTRPHLKPSETRHAMWISHVGEERAAVLLGGFAQHAKSRDRRLLPGRAGLPAILPRQTLRSLQRLDHCAGLACGKRAMTSSFSACNSEQVTYSNLPSTLSAGQSPCRIANCWRANPSISSGCLRILMSGLRRITPVAEHGTSAKNGIKRAG